MSAVKLRLRQIIHFFRRKHAKALRVALIVMICFALLFLGIDRGSNYMEVDILPKFPFDTNYYNYFSPNETSTDTNVPHKSDKLKSILRLTMDRIRDLSPQDSLDKTKGEECKVGDIAIDDIKNFKKTTRSELLKCIHLSDLARDELKDLHIAFLDTLNNDILPNFPMDIYNGTGIVIVAGGKFTMFAMPAIKAIRANGDGDIPIEIMIPPENNGESSFCEKILPKLDSSGMTRCVFMDKLFDKETLETVKGYQLKALALLASSFEKTLLLDADNYVINSIANVFNSKVFKTDGLVLWPDYWRRLHHPRLYDIVGIKVDTKKQVRYSIDNVSPPEIYKSDILENTPFHDFEGAIPDGGTESGQLLVDKAKHLDTIILSLYYNYNGPSNYYPLLGQGYAGEGDKDTFALASKALEANGIPKAYYQVKTPVSAMGHWTHKKDEILALEEDGAPESEKQFRGVAMLQHDILSDYTAYEKASEEISAKYLKEFQKYAKESVSAKNPIHDTDYDKKLHQNFWKDRKGVNYRLSEFMSYFKDTPVTFVHSHLPKYDPWEFAKGEDMKFDGRKAMDRNKDDPNFKPKHHGHYRMYNDEFSKITNYDLELANWICFSDYICTSEDGYKSFSYLQEEVESSDHGKEKFIAMCSYIDNRIEMLRRTTWDGSNF